MPVSIRFATPADAGLILRFIRGLADYERASNAVRASAAELRAQMESAAPPFECLIAEIDAEPAGFALFYRSYSTWLGQPLIFLEDLFVEPAHRGAGAGIALFKELARVAAERGYSRIEWRVLDWNAPAQRFYQSAGAAPLDGWTIWRLEGGALAALAHEAKLPGAAEAKPAK